MRVNLRIIAVNIKTKEKKLVEEIIMGQSSTSIIFSGSITLGNSTDYDFYHEDREIDIYRSSAFNPYMTVGDFICYKKEKEVKNKNIPF